MFSSIILFSKRNLCSAYKLLPGHCLLCGLASGRQLDLCHACESILPFNRDYCPCCAIPLEQSRLCGQCLAKPPGFNRVVAPLLFMPPVSSFIARFKNKGDYLAGVLLSRSLIKAIEVENLSKPDLLFAVPLHWRKRFLRGFNQAEWLARQIAKRFGWQFADGLHKTRFTSSQRVLDRRQRQKNLKGSFTLKIDVSGKHIALVDDVMTTGSTVAEITQLLLEAGAAKVDVFCLARTPLEK